MEVVEPLVKLVRLNPEGTAGQNSDSLSFCSLPSACLAEKQVVHVCRPPVKLVHGQAYLLLWLSAYAAQYLYGLMCPQEGLSPW